MMPDVRGDGAAASGNADARGGSGDAGASRGSGDAGAGDATAFLDTLFERAAEYAGGDRFSTIADADDFFTKIVGVSFEGRQDLVAGLAPGDAVTLAREPENPYDPNAVAVRFGSLRLGFLRREIAARLAPEIDDGRRYTALVASVTGGGARSIGVNIHVRRERLAARAPERDARRPRRPGDAASAPDSGAGSSTSDGVDCPGGDGGAAATADAAVLRPAEADREAIAADVLHALIGERPLRAAQLAVLARVSARRNTLAIMGTGRGKSVCFQLPAAERALAAGERTLVLYPLRALANDQFDALSRKLVPLGVRVLRANGAIDAYERAELDAALETGEWDLILATPEFASFHRAAFARPCNRPSLLVVDEAHHIFESRHRPAYGELRSLVAELGSPQVLALTATANDAAFAAIREALGIEAWIVDPTVRENLRVVDARDAPDKFAYLARELAGDGKAIVYCNSRAEATKVAERLRASTAPGVAFYHAGVPSAERARVESLFRAGEIRIVVATSAFGEGIDLPDVRDVVLFHLNFDFTEFNQMAGRAGRDGAFARVHLLFGRPDRRINDFIIAKAAPTLAKLRALWRGLAMLGGDECAVRTSYEEIARTLDLDGIAGATVGAAVRIFEEAGIAVAGTDDDGRFVRLLQPAGKVDLTQTARYAEGEAERAAFERFAALALSADAATLESIVNRPIYPDRVPLER